MKKEQFKVVCQKWEEVEPGWGIRPDGYSIHLKEEDIPGFVKEELEDYAERLYDIFHAKNGKDQPDRETKISLGVLLIHEYSKPAGTPYLCKVDEETFEAVKNSRNGVRFYERPPGSGGIVTGGFRYSWTRSKPRMLYQFGSRRTPDSNEAVFLERIRIAYTVRSYGFSR